MINTEEVRKFPAGLLFFVYHCFDRIVINGYVSGLSWPEQVVRFFRQVIGVPILSTPSSIRFNTVVGRTRF
jgi:hypothetical protein